MGDFDLCQAIGGTVTCRKLSAAFYGRVARDPVLAARSSSMRRLFAVAGESPASFPL